MHFYSNRKVTSTKTIISEWRFISIETEAKKLWLHKEVLGPTQGQEKAIKTSEFYVIQYILSHSILGIFHTAQYFS
jgi:hypothetical protein